MKKDLIRIIIIFLVIVGVIFWTLNYIFLNKQGPKSKASTANETLELLYDPKSAAPAANAIFNVTLKVKPSVEVFLRGFSIDLRFAKDILQLTGITYKQPAFTVSSGLGKTGIEADLTAINKSGLIKLVGESQSENGQLLSTSVTGNDLVTLTFKAKSTTGTSFRINVGDAKFFTVLSSDMELTEMTIVAPAQFDINGGGALPTVGSTSNPAPTGGSTGGANSNVRLNMKLKFQGITKKPADNQNSMAVSVKLKKENSSNSEVFSSSGTFIADNAGIWSGTVGFNIKDISGKWLVYIKGPQHLQKKICVSAPTETNNGVYRCSDGAITLTTGDNTLNFSGIVLLVGDLDRSGIVDSVDFGMVKNNLGKTDSTVLAKADLNRDGRVDTQDFSLILAALSIRTDEL